MLSVGPGHARPRRRVWCAVEFGFLGELPDEDHDVDRFVAASAGPLLEDPSRDGAHGVRTALPPVAAREVRAARSRAGSRTRPPGSR
ncbi:GAF domain-containing protein [Streptomyces hygroscopicus]|nr:GAF domain-containing protein [Streptomyces hygroscopicus]